jgi:hypothetical protein
MWIGTWNSLLGWGGYEIPRRVATSDPGGPSGWHLWQQVLIWLALASIWVVAAPWNLRSRGFEAEDSRAPAG